MGILSGYKRFKKYLRTGEGYKLCSEWTKSDSVEMTNGSTLQESVDSIVSDVENAQNNITDVHNELMTSLGGMTFGVDAAGNYGYIKAGADTVTPFKNMESIMSNVEFTSQSIHKDIWNNNGTSEIKASYKVPNDGIVKVICTSSYYRFGNIGTSNSNVQWHTITINNNEILNNIASGRIYTLDVKKNDIITHNYSIKYTGGDTIYASVTSGLATLFFEK